MTSPDFGVDMLFRSATDGLHPDIDGLVAAGIDRGRRRRRRHLAGTAVAVVATFGVIGGAVAVVPTLDATAGRNVSVATGEEAPTPTTPPVSPTPTPSTTPHLSEPGRPTVPAAAIPRRVDALVPGHQVSAPLTAAPYGVRDADSEKIVHFKVDGMLTTLIVSPASASAAYDCTDEAIVECRTLADGTVVQLPKPTTADQVTTRGVIAIGKTWMVDVMSYNAAEGKDVVPVQPEPALSEEELVTLATSSSWFE